MKFAKIVLLSVLILTATPTVEASLQPNESFEEYLNRTREEIESINYTLETVCGDGICEGLEFDTCTQDCRLLNSTTTAVQGELNLPQQFESKNILQILFAILGASTAGAVVWRKVSLKKKREEEGNKRYS
jgi:hypothetical protein